MTQSADSHMDLGERVDLTDDEVDAICAGLVQNAAKVRYLRQVLRVQVNRRPNGRPLVRRVDWVRSRRHDQIADDVAGPNWSRQL